MPNRYQKLAELLRPALPALKRLFVFYLASLLLFFVGSVATGATGLVAIALRFVLVGLSPLWVALGWAMLVSVLYDPDHGSLALRRCGPEASQLRRFYRWYGAVVLTLMGIAIAGLSVWWPFAFLAA